MSDPKIARSHACAKSPRDQKARDVRVADLDSVLDDLREAMGALGDLAILIGAGGEEDWVLVRLMGLMRGAQIATEGVLHNFAVAPADAPRPSEHVATAPGGVS